MAARTAISPRNLDFTSVGIPAEDRQRTKHSLSGNTDMMAVRPHTPPATAYQFPTSAKAGIVLLQSSGEIVRRPY